MKAYFLMASAATIHLLQTTPYIFTASLIAQFGKLPILAAVLLLASCVLLVWSAIGFFLISRVSPISPPSISPRSPSLFIIAAYLAIASINWFALFWLIDSVGASASILVMACSASIAIWFCQSIMKSKHHRTANFKNVVKGTGLIIFAAVVIAKNRLGSGMNTYDLIEATGPVLLAVSCVVALAILKPILTDPAEAFARNRSHIRVQSLVCIETFVAALVMLLLNMWTDGGQTLLALVPETVMPHTWTGLHWSIVWVGVVNTAFGVVVSNHLSNAMGLPVSNAIGQCRPIMAEILNVVMGASTLTFVAVVDLSSATMMLMMAAIVFKSPSSSNNSKNYSASG